MPTSPLLPSIVGPSVYIYNPSSSSAAAATQAGYPSFFSTGGGLQATRLAALNAQTCFIACHHNIFRLALTYPAPPPFSSSTAGQQHQHQQVTPLTRMAFQRSPLFSPSPVVLFLFQASHKPTEVQHLCFIPNKQALAAIDSAATVHLYSRPSSSPTSTPSSFPSPAPPGDFPRFGWAGLAFDPHHPSRLATLRTYGQVLSFLDVSPSSSSSSSTSFHPLWDAPTALAYLSPSSLHSCSFSVFSCSSSFLAVAEGYFFSLWDERCASPCEAREQPLPLTRIVTLEWREREKDGEREGGQVLRGMEGGRGGGGGGAIGRGGGRGGDAL
ncbi:hypothetical protein VYU27_009443 [Nannochloropsis oceanica]